MLLIAAGTSEAALPLLLLPLDPLAGALVLLLLDPPPPAPVELPLLVLLLAQPAIARDAAATAVTTAM
ncbi:MAG: hypothetical protein J0H43_06775 [Actinobacteria bacterium]|nr:hypothetical protein [Actinomycetota bacterium]